MCEMTRKLMNTPFFSFQDFKLSTKDIIGVLKDTLNTTSSLLPIPEPHVTRVPSNTLERHSISSRVVDGVRNLVISSSMAKLLGSFTFDSSFTYQKGTKNTSLVDLLLNKGIQVGGHTPIMVLLDTGAQPMIVGVQFAKKMGMFDFKLRKFMWQILTTSGNVKEVLGESSDLIAFNFNEGKN